MQNGSLFQSFVSAFITQPTSSTYADRPNSSDSLFTVRLPSKEKNLEVYDNLNYFSGLTNDFSASYRVTAEAESTRPVVPSD